MVDDYGALCARWVEDNALLPGAGGSVGFVDIAFEFILMYEYTAG